jgi:predicted dehydrogenase
MTTPEKNTIRFGIVGLGNMGSAHAKWLLNGDVKGATLAAVCDVNEDKLKAYPDCTTFTDVQQMIDSGKIDALLIATPHYDHTTIGIASLKAGLHTLVEKPISVHKEDCEKLIAAHTDPKVVFGAMFNQRTDPYYRKIRELIQSGELGEIRRINWIITNWFRTECYYASGGWRATWSGEGGGVLLNQCPHNIDLWQWLFGMPQEVWADCQIGRYHDIEVEDDVTAYFRYASGATGVFITSTGEAPGTNRLEITAERGKLVYEDDRLTYTRNEQPMSEFSSTTDSAFGKPDVWQVDFPSINNGKHGPQHVGILNNFVAAINGTEELLAPAAEGIHSVELANAMLFASAQGATVHMPLDAQAYAKLLKERISTSTFVKKAAKAPAGSGDFSKSFN